MEVTVRYGGMQTTVQDLGRVGYRADGVPLSGAMDGFAMRVANLLVGNRENSAVLEFAIVGPVLEFSADALVAVTGAEFSGVPAWRPFGIRAGEALRLDAAREGCRGYLAIAGGFEVPQVLGSSSTYVRAGLGGFCGRGLRTGDVLRAPDLSRDVANHWSIDPRILPAYSPSPTVRVVPGAQAAEFGRAFFHSRYKVTMQSDRMGLRLKGQALVRESTEDLRSSTVLPGTIQVPPDGHPIVLMADAQTIGGYPQIAHVIRVDLPVVAQLRPGNTVGFREIALEEARELVLARERALAMLRQGLALKLG